MANKQEVVINGKKAVYLTKSVAAGDATGYPAGTVIFTTHSTGRKGIFVSNGSTIEVANLSAIPVKATGAEANTGTDDAKFLTAKALKDADLAKAAATPAAGDFFYFRTVAGVVKKIAFSDLAAAINA